VRKQSDGVAYFEIDDANNLSFKQARLAESGIGAPIKFIPGNYVADGVLPLLEANGFKCDVPTFFIWEGNTMYLTRDAVMKVLTEFRERVPAFRLSFDYMSEEVIAYATGDRGTSGFVERFAAMGAPWHFGLNDLGALAEEAAMSVVDAVTVTELHRAYWPGRPWPRSSMSITRSARLSQLEPRKSRGSSVQQCGCAEPRQRSRRNQVRLPWSEVRGVVARVDAGDAVPIMILAATDGPSRHDDDRGAFHDRRRGNWNRSRNDRDDGRRRIAMLAIITVPIVDFLYQPGGGRDGCRPDLHWRGLARHAEGEEASKESHHGKEDVTHSTLRLFALLPLDPPSPWPARRMV